MNNILGMKSICRTLFLCIFSLQAIGQDCRLDDAWAKLQTLEGSWKIENTQSIEIWYIANDTLLNGKAFKLTGRDTLLSESIQLIKTKNDIQYKAKVSGQNIGKSIPFILMTCTNQTLIFENPAHDYPQKIGYRFINPNTLLAWIEGIQDGKMKKTDFPMKKISK